jgi:predicted alpha/beta-hydrolase family hydrolase
MLARIDEPSLATLRRVNAAREGTIAGRRAMSIEVPGEGPVSGALHTPPNESGVAIALAPGAGSSFDNAFLVAVAEGLAARGHTVLRFNFVYRERGSGRPDPAKKLVATYRAAADVLRAQGGRKLVIGGRSMGGRMASMLAAEGYACDGLVFLGYPLHPAGKPEQLRDAHLPRVRAPMLFVQGTRDALCDLELLRPVLARVGPRATLHEVAGADHGFEVRKMDGRTPDSVLAEVVDASASFIEANVV